MPAPTGHAPPAPDVSTAAHKARPAAIPVLAPGPDAPLRGLQRSLGNHAVTKLAQPHEHAVAAAHASPGRPLDAPVRADLEARMGENLEDVRVHLDPQAAKAAGARAYATGNHIVVDSAAQAAQTAPERRRLAHEVAHVVQARRPHPANAAGDTEAAANRTADAIAGGAPSAKVEGRTRAGIARDETAEVPAHHVSYAPADVGFTNLQIDGVTVLRFADSQQAGDIAVAAGWSGDEPTIIRIAIRRRASVSALLDRKGVAELRKRGFEVIPFDQVIPTDLSELGDRAIRVPSPPPRRPAATPPARKASKKPPAATVPAATIPAAPVASPDRADQPVAQPDKADQPVDGAPLPVDPVPATAPETTPKEAIDARTSWWNDLDEAALGSDLLARATSGNPDFAQHVLDEVGATDRDDVALAFAEAATDEQLRQLASTERGRRLLDRLYDELTTGEVFADEQKQADRILALKTQSLLTEGQFAAGIAKAQSRSGIILPYRKPGITVLTPSPIYAVRLPDGKISVHVRMDIFGTDYARDPDLRLPQRIWDGIVVNETDVVGIKRYDEGGTIDFVPALALLAIANEADTVAYHKAAEAFGIGLTLGIGGGVAAGGEATGGEATLGTGARLLAGARRGVAIADRAATAIEIGNSVLQEHRGWIIETWPGSGRELVVAVDQIAAYARVYGVVRGSVGLVQLGNNLRNSYRNWRTATAALKGLSESELADVEKIGSDTERMIQEIESAGAGDVADITSATQRRYPPNVARKLAQTPEGAGDVVPLRQHATGEAAIDEAVPQAVAQPLEDEQPLLRASGDNDVRASAGSRRTTQRGGGQPPQTTTNAPGPARRASSVSGGGGGAAAPPIPIRRALPPEHVPEPVLHPIGIDRVPPAEALDFFRKNRASYPKRVQDMIDDAKVPTQSAAAAIDRELREDYAQRANRALGFPGPRSQISRPAPVPGGRILEEASPFSSSVKGHTPGNPGKEFEAGVSPTPLGDRKNLNLVGRTKSGEVVELDDFNFRDRSGEEIKMPNALQNDPRFRAAGEDQIVSELRRHYDFTRDWNFNPYRWNLHTYDDYKLVERLAEHNLPADWTRYLKITWIQ